METPGNSKRYCCDVRKNIFSFKHVFIMGIYNYQVELSIILDVVIEDNLLEFLQHI